MRWMEIKEFTPKEVDALVCEWSMAKGVALTEEQLNNLVDRICVLIFGHAPVVKACPPHSWDSSGERCTKCGDKDWMT